MTEWDLAEPYLWARARLGMSKQEVDEMPYWLWARQRLYTAWFDAEQAKRSRGG